jgi:hypothetical protein
LQPREQRDTVGQISGLEDEVEEHRRSSIVIASSGCW